MSRHIGATFKWSHKFFFFFYFITRLISSRFLCIFLSSFLFLSLSLLRAHWWPCVWLGSLEMTNWQILYDFLYVLSLVDKILSKFLSIVVYLLNEPGEPFYWKWTNIKDTFTNQHHSDSFISKWRNRFNYQFFV